MAKRASKKMTEDLTIPPAAPKRRGRPPKIRSEAVQVFTGTSSLVDPMDRAPKRRGRPPKVRTEAAAAPAAPVAAKPTRKRSAAKSAQAAPQMPDLTYVTRFTDTMAGLMQMMGRMMEAMQRRIDGLENGRAVDTAQPGIAADHQSAWSKEAARAQALGQGLPQSIEVLDS